MFAHIRFVRFVGLALLMGLTTPASAGWQDMLNKAKEVAGDAVGEKGSSGTSLSSLTQGEAGKGLKEALGKGVERAVKSLGSADGYLKNAKVRIPLPEQLETVKKGLKMAGQDKLANDFEVSMNRAAEKAVHEAAPVFGKAISSMSFEDAKNILNGGDTAATDYLRKSSGGELATRMKPLVEEATSSTDATGYYKKMVSAGQQYAGGAADSLGGSLGGWGKKLTGMIDPKTLDVDQYVTDKAMDGLYTVLAEQEKQIRSNPGEWTSSTLKKVFGSIK